MLISYIEENQKDLLWEAGKRSTLSPGQHRRPQNYSDDGCQPGMWIWTSALVTWFGTLRLLFQMIKDLSDLYFHEVQHTDFYKEGVCVLLLVLRVNIRMCWKINAFSKTPDSSALNVTNHILEDRWLRHIRLWNKSGLTSKVRFIIWIQIAQAAM